MFPYLWEMRLVDVIGMVMLIIICHMHIITYNTVYIYIHIKMYILFVWFLPKHWKTSGFHEG